MGRRIITTLLLLGLVACTTQPRTSDQLYRDLGGEAGVDALVAELVEIVHTDERIAFLFKPENRADLHVKIVEQICMETGGGCEYTGLSMTEAHGGLGIRESEFEIFVEDFIMAMERRGIDFQTQNRVLAIFAPMRGEIIHQ